MNFNIKKILILIFFCLQFFSLIARYSIYPLDSDYQDPDSLLPKLIDLHSLNSDVASIRIIGYSSNYDLPIYGFNISLDKKKDLPSVLVIGQHHSEEVIGLELSLHFIEYLLSNFETNSEVNFILKNLNFWIIPTINPEGFEIVNRGIGRLHRKNKTDTNFNGQFDLYTDGVDLNRNYPFNWEKDDSTSPESKYFKGYYPACQSEIQSMITFFGNENFQLAFFYHSSATGAYSEKIFFPWRWGENVSPDYYEMLSIARVYAENTPKLYDFGNYEVHKSNTSKRGFARDYIYSEHRTYAFLIEVGGNSPYGEGILSPDNFNLNRLKTHHTKSFLKVLDYYLKNVCKFTFYNIERKPLRNHYVEDLYRSDKKVNQIKTNDFGSIFYFSLNNEFDIKFKVGDYLITEKIDRNTNYHTEFKINIIPELKVNFNNNRPLILLDPIFYTIPSLKTNRRQEHNLYFNFFQDGHLVGKELKRGIDRFDFYFDKLTSSERTTVIIKDNNNPVFIEKPTAKFDLFYLSGDEVKISYCNKYSPGKKYILQPKSKISLTFEAAPGSNINYKIQNIVIHGISNNNETTVLLYIRDIESGSIIYQKKHSLANHQGSFFITDLDVCFNNGIKIVLQNTSLSPLVIFREVNDFYTVRSNQQKEYFTDWKFLEGGDLAIDLILIRD